MDTRRLDTLLPRSLISFHSRRGALVSLLGGTLGLFGLADTEAKNARGQDKDVHGEGKKKKKKKKKKKRPTTATQTPPPPPSTVFSSPGTFAYIAPGTGTVTVEVLAAGGGHGGPGGSSADTSTPDGIIPGTPGTAGLAGGGGGKVTASFAIASEDFLLITVGAAGTPVATVGRAASSASQPQAPVAPVAPAARPAPPAVGALSQLATPEEGAAAAAAEGAARRMCAREARGWQTASSRPVVVAVEKVATAGRWAVRPQAVGPADRAAGGTMSASPTAKTAAVPYPLRAGVGTGLGRRAARTWLAVVERGTAA